MPFIQSPGQGGSWGVGDHGEGSFNPFENRKAPSGAPFTPPTDEEYQEAYDEFEHNLIEEQWQEYQDSQTGGGLGRSTNPEEEASQWVDPGMDEYSEYTDAYQQYTDYNVGKRYADIIDSGGSLEDFYKDLSYSINPDLGASTWNEVWENQQNLFSSVAYHKPELYNINRQSTAKYNNLMDKFYIDNFDIGRKRGQTGITSGSGLYKDIGKEKMLKDYELASKKIDHDLRLKEHGFYSDIGSTIWDLLARFTDLGGYDPSLQGA